MISDRMQGNLNTLAKYAANCDDPAAVGGQIAYFLGKSTEVRNTGGPAQLASVRAMVERMEHEDGPIDFEALNNELDRISGHVGIKLEG